MRDDRERLTEALKRATRAEQLLAEAENRAAAAERRAARYEAAGVDGVLRRERDAAVRALWDARRTVEHLRGGLRKASKDAARELDAVRRAHEATKQLLVEALGREKVLLVAARDKVAAEAVAVRERDAAYERERITARVFGKAIEQRDAARAEAAEASERAAAWAKTAMQRGEMLGQRALAGEPSEFSVIRWRPTTERPALGPESAWGWRYLLARYGESVRAVKWLPMSSFEDVEAWAELPTSNDTVPAVLAEERAARAAAEERARVAVASEQRCHEEQRAANEKTHKELAAAEAEAKAAWARGFSVAREVALGAAWNALSLDESPYLFYGARVEATQGLYTQLKDIRGIVKREMTKSLDEARRAG